jgi:hypothetical protein
MSGVIFNGSLAAVRRANGLQPGEQAGRSPGSLYRDSRGLIAGLRTERAYSCMLAIFGVNRSNKSDT